VCVVVWPPAKAAPAIRNKAIIEREA